MTLVSLSEYEITIGKQKDITPESILTMLRDVRSKIGKLESKFAELSLKEVLAIVENEKYNVEGPISRTVVNLSSANKIIKAYRRGSEGGCQSCVNLGRETIDAQDASSGFYCTVSDPDYDEDTIGYSPGVRYEGSSPKVKKHYNNPCDDWKPRFSPQLSELIRKES